MFRRMFRRSWVFFLPPTPSPIPPSERSSPVTSPRTPALLERALYSEAALLDPVRGFYLGFFPSPSRLRSAKAAGLLGSPQRIAFLPKPPTVKVNPRASDADLAGSVPPEPPRLHTPGPVPSCADSLVVALQVFARNPSHRKLFTPMGHVPLSDSIGIGKTKKKYLPQVNCVNKINSHLDKTVNSPKNIT